MARCTQCEWSFRLHQTTKFRRAIERHEATMCSALPAPERLAARVTGMRVALELARSRGRMWLAYPTYDPAKNATQVVREMVAFLEDAISPSG